MKRLLARCLEERRSVEMIYLSDGGTLSQRVVRVEKITNATVSGYCHLRRRYRTFKLNNILSVRPHSPKNTKMIS